MDFSHLIYVLDNAIIWIIFIFALVCYTLLIELILAKEKDQNWFDRTTEWLDTFPVLLAALPLLGLLGTISGLLETFLQMSIDRNLDHQQLMGGGIADAMFTTQMGLLMVCPGWVMLSYLKNLQKKWQVETDK